MNIKFDMQEKEKAKFTYNLCAAMCLNKSDFVLFESENGARNKRLFANGLRQAQVAY